MPFLITIIAFLTQRKKRAIDGALFHLNAFIKLQ